MTLFRPRILQKRAKKAGLPPGTLVHIGEERTGEPKVTLIDYDESHLLEKDLPSFEGLSAFMDRPSVTWVNVDGIQQVEILERIGNEFGLHPLVMEDILNTDQRPKVEEYDGYVYIVLKMLFCEEGCEDIYTEQVSLVLGRNFVLSFQEGIRGDVFEQVRGRIRNERGKARRMGADYLVYCLLDAVVDHYFHALERLGDQVEEIEDELVERPTIETLHDIHYMKRELLFLRKAVWPLREVLGRLERGEAVFFGDATRLYLRDVYDHTVQVIETLETFRDMVTGMLDIYLSSVSNRLNSVMKVLTVIATIFIPLTFIVGIYGMNFRYMPELEWRYGYALVWAVMIAIALSMVIVFKRKRWW